MPFTITVSAPELIETIDGATTELRGLREAIQSQEPLPVGDLAQLLRHQNEILERFYTLARWLVRPSRPENVQVTFVKEIHDMAREKDKEVYSVSVDPVKAKDVVKRHLTLVADGNVVHDQDYPPSTTSFGEFEFDQDALVDGSVYDEDDATPPNRSGELHFSFSAADKEAPDTPSGVAVAFVKEIQGAEIPDPVPTPDPVPEPEPTPDPAPTPDPVPEPAPEEPKPEEPAPEEPKPEE